MKQSFNFLYSPMFKMRAHNCQFGQLLQYMNEKDLEDPALVLTKKELPVGVLDCEDFKLPE